MKNAQKTMLVFLKTFLYNVSGSMLFWGGGHICYPTGSIPHVVCGKTFIKCAKYMYTLNSILIEETTLFFSVVT